ncbi:MAG: tRNA uridine-5-carboxymethylaminomethyl(34) synthesis GTPase MnmE [Gloeomargaritaceae cyanobacterium C42_A2020_066]|nr:tRNA uridine-5-carboxymethylaminomethyl(34) synthesis GTPase MnmE [Gloeomargaritaceae cyanobacterium C42_A2020_066]
MDYLTGTIVAVATPVVPQQGSIAVVRLSGSQAVPIAQALFEPAGRPVWESHRILYGWVRDLATGRRVDEALVLLMLAPRSYTREDVVEFHCHGGLIPVQQVLQLCVAQGARLAQPGEFTLRAFLNGRLDLTQAEAVADLVQAGSQAAARMALAGLTGKLSAPIQQMRATCLDVLAELEARLDFDEDLPPLDEAAIRQRLEAVTQTLDQVLATAERGALVRTGVQVAIVGRPNVGKSSLLNAWSRTDRAIVTDLPGTTRDVVESHLVVQGIPVRVLDTAGIRTTADRVEQMGVARSRQAIHRADLVLLTIDAQAGWTPEDERLYQEVRGRPLILVINKADLADAGQVPRPAEIHHWVATAAAHHQGIEALEDAIVAQVSGGQARPADLEWAINERQTAALQRARQALLQVQATAAAGLPVDFWTIDLRAALQALGEVTGDAITESILDRIFSRFCIGK